MVLVAEVDDWSVAEAETAAVVIETVSVSTLELVSALVLPWLS